MTHHAVTYEPKDIVHGDKYEHEAKKVSELLAHDPEAAAARLRADGKLAPHELHKFIAELKKDCAGLPNVTISDDQNGIGVSIKKDGSAKPTDLFKRAPEDLAKANDDIPKTGKLLGLSDEQIQKVLEQQQAEKAELIANHRQDLVDAGKGYHKFADIAVHLGFCTEDKANDALQQRDILKARQLTEDLSRGMPILRGEGPYQMLKRTHPELSDEVAASYAHIIKKLNGGKNEMRVGQELKVLTDEQAQALATEIYAATRKATGNITLY